MPYRSTLQRDLECTAAPTPTEVGVKGAGVGGVSTATVSPPSSVPTGIVSRSCGSPQHTPHATMQRMGGTGGSHEGAAAAPRGFKGSVSTTSTVADATKGVFKETPHTSPPPPPASSSSRAYAPLPRPGPEEKCSTGKFPALTRATPASSSSTLHSIGTSATAGASSPSSFVVLPPVQPLRSNSTVSELSSDEGRSVKKTSSRWANLGKPSSTSSALMERATLAPLVSPPITTIEQNPPTSDDVLSVPIASGSPQEDMSSASRDSPSHVQRQSYFRENQIPSLFNELSEALLDALPEDPVSFMKEWLRRRREAVAQ